MANSKWKYEQVQGDGFKEFHLGMAIWFFLPIIACIIWQLSYPTHPHTGEICAMILLEIPIGFLIAITGIFDAL